MSLKDIVAILVEKSVFDTGLGSLQASVRSGPCLRHGQSAASLRNGKKKLRGLSPRANYTDRAAAAGRRS